MQKFPVFGKRRSNNRASLAASVSRSRRHRVALGAGAAALAVAVAACGSSTTTASSGGSGGTSKGASGSASAAAAGSLPTVTIAYTAPVADQLIPMIAEKAGLFTKYGVNVKMTYLPQTQALDGLVGGSVQMAVFDSPAPEVAVAGGQSIKWIAEWENHADLFLMGRPGVSSVSALSGKAVAETVAGSTTAVLTQVALKQAGVLSSAHLQPVGNVGATLSAFLAGSVQATIAGPPNQDTLIKEVPGSKILVDFTKSDPWVGGGLAAPDAWTSAHRTETIDVLKALAAGVAYFKSNEAASVNTIQQATKTTQANATAAYQSMLSIIDNTPSLVPSASVESDVLPAIAATSPGAAKLTGSDVINTTYVKAAQSGSSSSS